MLRIVLLLVAALVVLALLGFMVAALKFLLWFAIIAAVIIAIVGWVGKTVRGSKNRT